MVKKFRSNINLTFIKKFKNVLLLIFVSFLFSHIFSFVFPTIIEISDERINDNFFRLRYKLSGKQKIDPRIIHLDITDRDIDELNINLHDRTVFSRILDLIAKTDINALAVDIIFEENLNSSIPRSSKNIENIFYPMALTLQNPNFQRTYSKFLNLEYICIDPTVLKHGAPFQGTPMIYPYDELIHSAKGIGHITCNPDADGIIRKFPLVIRKNDTDNMYYPGLILKMLIDHFQVPDKNIIITFGKHITLKNAMVTDQHKKDIVIPIDKHGRMRINWAGPWEDSFAHYSVGKILKAESNPAVLESLTRVMENRFVLFADVSTRNQDYDRGIFNSVYPLAGVHTNILNNILLENFLHEPVFGATLFFSLLLAALIFLYTIRFSFLNYFYLYFGTLLLFPLVNFIIFLLFNRISAPTVPMAGFILSFIMCTGYRMLCEEKEKTQIEEQKRFEQVKKDFLTQLSHNLKTPLTLILGAIDEVQKKEETSSDKAMHVIDRQSYQLLNLLNQFIELSTLESGGLKTEFTYIDPVKYVSRVVSVLKVFLLDKEIMIYYTSSCNATIARVDCEKFEMILYNLIFYIISFLKNDKTVRLSLSESTQKNPGSSSSLELSISAAKLKFPEDDILFLNENNTDNIYQFLSHKINPCLILVKELIQLHSGHITTDINDNKTYIKFSLPTLNQNDLPEKHELNDAGITDRLKRMARAYCKVMSEQIVDNDSHKDSPKKELESSKQGKITVIQSNPDMMNYLSQILSPYFNIDAYDTGKEACRALRSNQTDLIILDYLLNDMKGPEIITSIRSMKKHHKTMILMITSGYDEKLPDADENGPNDFIKRPFLKDELLMRVKNLLKIKELTYQVVTMTKNDGNTTVNTPEVFSHIITKSPLMFDIFKYIEILKDSPKPVLITGETGVGKELIAQAVYRCSNLAGKAPDNFVTVNIAGRDKNLISDDLFGHVRGAFSGADKDRSGLLNDTGNGVLFLDEIGDLDYDIQVKLLRLIEYNEYSPLGSDKTMKSQARIIAATNARLQNMVDEKKFREDLYYRLTTHHIRIPPLRERLEDIPLLVDFFVDKASNVLDKDPVGVSANIINLLSSYDFPGNIRELEAMIFDAVSKCTSDSLDIDYFKKYLNQKTSTRNSTAINIIPAAQTGITIHGGILPLDKMRSLYVDEVINMTKSLSEAARLLDKNVSTISRIRKKNHK